VFVMFVCALIHDRGMEKVLLSEVDVQTFYGVAVHQLRRMRARGDGPQFVKVSGTMGKTGGRVLYRVKDIEAWLATKPTGGKVAAAQ